MHSLKITLLAFLLSSSFNLVKAQNLNVTVTYERSEDGNTYTFYAINNTGDHAHLVVSFSKYSGLMTSAVLPFQKNVSVGKSRLFVMERVGIAKPDFRYGISYWKGKANPKLEDVEYAIPLDHGKETRTMGLKLLSETYGKQAGDKSKELPQDDGLYLIGFKCEEGDTIRAARGGLVIEVEQSKQTVDPDGNYTFKDGYNSIVIRHGDGTKATYRIFKNASALVKEKSVVQVGDPLALATGVDYRSGPHVRFNVTYLKVIPKPNTTSREWSSTEYLKPLFRTLNNEKTALQPNIKYEAVINDDLITQEMSKRQKKKYYKSRSK